MKALLHLAAVSAATHMKEGEYKDYFERKTKEGKHVMCVLNVIRAKPVFTECSPSSNGIPNTQRNINLHVNHAQVAARPGLTPMSAIYIHKPYR